MTGFGFGDCHGAEWRFSLKDSRLFWGKLAEKLELKP